MEHQGVFAFAVIAGLLVLTLLAVLALHQGRAMVALLRTMRGELTHLNPAGVAPRIHPMDPADPAPLLRRAAESARDTDRTMAAQQDETLVSVPALDEEGSSRSKKVALETLLRAAGIGPGVDDPELAVVTQAQSEIKALADLASCATNDGDLELGALGGSLTGIYHRLEVAAELRGRDAHRSASPSSDDGPDEADDEPGPTSDPEAGGIH